MTDSILILRCDADSRIGSGHLMRCYAIAQGWKAEGGEAVFISTVESPAVKTRLESEGFKIIFMPDAQGSREDASFTCHQAQALGARWIVTDGYHFTTDYQRMVRSTGLKIMAVDDYHRIMCPQADAILDHNIGASESAYFDRDSNTQLLLGSDYVLLRKEFLKWREWERKPSAGAHKVLISLGGADPENLTMKIAEALIKFKVEDLEVKFVTGAFYPFGAELKNVVKELPFQANIEKSPGDMAQLMAWADMAVTAGGTTCWELSFMGLPALVFITAENQRIACERLHTARIVLNLGQSVDFAEERFLSAFANLLMSPDQMETMSRNGRRLVDGKGTERVCQFLKKLSYVKGTAS